MSFNAALQQLFTGSASFIAGLIVVQDPVSHVILSGYNTTGYISLGILAIAFFWAYRLSRAMPKATKKNPIITATEALTLTEKEPVA